MPELPEVEVVRRDLAEIITGRRITDVVSSNARVLRRYEQLGDFDRVVRGRRVVTVGRRGKNIVVGFDNDASLVVHLGMSGQLLHAPAPKRVAPPIHTHVVLRVAGAGEVRYVDPRTFGELFVVPAGVEPLAHLGPDALDALPIEVFAALLGSRRVQMKALLMDQRAIAGLGNIYSDEALFAAGVRGNRSSASLSSEEINALHRAITTILRDAVAAGGSSLADAQYVDLRGEIGRYQQRHAVYAREGKPCVRCGTAIERARWGGRSTFSCPTCQR